MARGFQIRVCRGCGCDDNHACLGGCAWVLLDVKTPTGVCSQCAIDLDWSSRALITVGIHGDFPLAGAEAADLVIEPPRILLP